VDNLYAEIRKCVEANRRVLVTTLTKRMAEDLTEYYAELGVRVRYLHSDISTLERMEIIRELRMGKFDVLIGINLLREGLDIPEVALVAIMDADKEGFLRSVRSLIQTFGRAARNVDGRVILYAEETTDSMARAIEETERRRAIQAEFNQKNDIVPQSIQKNITSLFDSVYKEEEAGEAGVAEPLGDYLDTENIEATIADLEKRMHQAAKDLEFEQAAVLRDRIRKMKQRLLYEL
jgi:excinuclease ABC subunit B